MPSLFRYGLPLLAIPLIALSACDRNASAPEPLRELPEERIQARIDSMTRGRIFVDVGEGGFLFGRDLLISKTELRELALAAEPVAGRSSGTVLTSGGKDRLTLEEWRDGVTFCFDGTFSQSELTKARSAMNSAVQAWNALLPFHFTERVTGTCTPDAENYFAITRSSIGQDVLASAFFPSTPQANRFLIITPSSLTLTNQQMIELLSHELGHILGLRHEHVHPDAILVSNAPQYCSDDDHLVAGWIGASGGMTSGRAVTAYDQASVMVYPECVSSNTNIAYPISASDRATITALYPAVGKNRYAASVVTFPADWQIPSGVSTAHTTLYKPYVLDLNDDGYSDLVILGPTKYYKVTSSASGTYSTSATSYPSGISYPTATHATGTTYSTVLGDVNGDGRVDLRRLGGTKIHTFLNQGDGTFGISTADYGTLDPNDGLVKDLFDDVIPDFDQPQVVANAYGDWTSLGGDFETYHTTDGQSNPGADFVRIGPNGLYLSARGYDNVAYPMEFPAEWGSYSSRFYGWLSMDLDGTGRHSILRIDNNPSGIRVASWDQAASNRMRFDSPSMPAGLSFGGMYGFSYRMYAADVDGDHRQELVAVGNDKAVTVRFTGSFSDGSGAIGQVINSFGVTNTTYGIQSPNYQEVIADVNGDGRDDLVRISAYQVTCYFGQANGEFSIGTSSNNGSQSFFTGFGTVYENEVMPGDADHNGKDDLFVVGRTSLRILKN